MYSFSYLEPVCCSMPSSNCCFLTCIQVSQEADQVFWYSHLFQNFPQFVVIHTVKGFGIVNKPEIDLFIELSSFFHDPVDVGNLISGFPFLKPALTSGSSWFMYCWSLSWRVLIYIQQLYIHIHIYITAIVCVYIYIYTHTHSVHSGFLMLFLVLPRSYMNNSCKHNRQECAPQRAM